MAVPPEYQGLWRQAEKAVWAPAALDEIPRVSTVGFSFFLPTFSGYTPDNYSKPFDPDRVDIVSLEAADPREAEPDAPGNYPPNVIKRLLRSGLIDEESHREEYGLTCYHASGDVKRLTCYGRADERREEYIVLQVEVPPFDSSMAFPLLQTTYFTRRYEGLEILWRTHAKNFARWRDIDAKVWELVDSWNIAQATSANPKGRGVK